MALGLVTDGAGLAPEPDSPESRKILCYHPLVTTVAVAAGDGVMPPDQAKNCSADRAWRIATSAIPKGAVCVQGANYVISAERCPPSLDIPG